MMNNMICPNCGEDSGVSNVLLYYGPPLRCRSCGKELWSDTRPMC